MNSEEFQELLEIARVCDWSTQGPLLKAEDQYIAKKDSICTVWGVDPLTDNYLSLGSLCFYHLDNQFTGLAVNALLDQIWPDTWLDRNKELPSEWNCRLPTLPRGNIRPTYMVIGDAPGIGHSPGMYDRTLTYGPSSHLLRKALLKLGIYYNCFFSNLVKVSQVSNKLTGKEEVLKWQSYLLKEITLLDPKQIILLGSHVSEMFAQFYAEYTRAKVSNVYHPSYYVRMNRNYEEYARHIQGRI